MSTDFSIRPVGSPAPSPIVPPFSQAAGNAVATELPASQSVTAADAATALRNDPIDVVEDFAHQAYFDRDAQRDGLSGRQRQDRPGGDAIS